MPAATMMAATSGPTLSSSAAFHSTPRAKHTSAEFIARLIDAMKKSQEEEEEEEEAPDGPGVQRDELGRVFVQVPTSKYLSDLRNPKTWLKKRREGTSDVMLFYFSTYVPRIRFDVV
jgi:hypothetical protein